MTSNVWADPIDRVGSSTSRSVARKRHLYERDGGSMSRLCGTVDRDGPIAASPGQDDLTRIDGERFARSTNACQKCLDISGLDALVDGAGSGAASVDADPFGVFDDPDPGFDGEAADVAADGAGEARQQDVDEAVPMDDVTDIELTFESDLEQRDDGSAPLQKAIDLADQDITFEGSFTVDLDQMDDEDVVDWMAMFFDVPPSLVEYLLKRGADDADPSDPTFDDAVDGLLTAVRYAEQADDVPTPLGADISQAYHDMTGIDRNQTDD